MSTRTSDSGQALPLALITLAMGVILVTVFLFAVSTYLRLSGEDATALLDYYAADGGIERAIAPLATNPAAYPSDAMLTDVTLNERSATVNVHPLGVQTVIEPGPSGTITTTVTSYLITSTVSTLSVTARVETRQQLGQSTATVRIRAWKVGHP